MRQMNDAQWDRLLPQAEDYNTPDGNSKVMVLGH